MNSSNCNNNERLLLKETILRLKQENQLLKQELSRFKNDQAYDQTREASLEQKFKLIIDHIKKLPVQGYNANREVIYWNKASEKLYGYTHEEAFGKKIEDLIIPKEMKDNVVQSVNNWVKNDIPIPPSELILRNKHNNKIHVFSNHSLIENSLGEKEMYCIDIDLSDLKKKETELFKTKNHINSIFKAADKVSFIIVGTDTDIPKILEFSPGAENIFNYEKDEVINQNLSVFDTHGNEQRFSEIIESIKYQKNQITGESYFSKKNGEQFLGIFSAYPLEVSPNNCDAVLIVIMDISQEQKAKSELENSKNLINAVLNSIQDGIIIFDTNLNIQFANNVAKNLFQNSIPLNSKCYQELYNINNPCPQCPALKCMLSGKTETKILAIPSPTSPITIEVFCYPIIDITNKNIKGAVELIRDITKRRELEKQLRHSQKMESIGKLAGGIAHDFNNFLTIINGYCELLSEHQLDNEAMEYITKIHTTGLKAEKLTGQLLAFSRKQIAKPAELDVNEIIINHIDMITGVLGEDIKITTNLNDSGSKIYMDPVQFEQILMNLSVNARDAMPNGGTLFIGTESLSALNHEIEGVEIKQGTYTIIKIKDSGIGMTEDIKNKIFDPFFTTKAKNKGTGLGLSTVYGIIKQNKGYVFIDTEPEHGTLFSIMLPQILSPSIQPVLKIESQVNHYGNETILYVEDSESVRSITIAILRKYGYKIYAPTSPMEAIEVFDNLDMKVDLLFTDVIMPEINGKELADILRSKNKKLKVLYTSGYTGKNISRHGLEEGRLNFIQKPYTVKDITKKIRSILDHD